MYATRQLCIGAIWQTNSDSGEKVPRPPIWVMRQGACHQFLSYLISLFVLRFSSFFEATLRVDWCLTEVQLVVIYQNTINRHGHYLSGP